MSESEWAERFAPRVNPSVPGQRHLEAGDPYQVDYASRCDPAFVWTELDDTAGSGSLLRNGYLPKEAGAISWYVCKLPWTEFVSTPGTLTVTMEW